MPQMIFCRHLMCTPKLRIFDLKMQLRLSFLMKWYDRILMHFFVLSLSSPCPHMFFSPSMELILDLQAQICIRKSSRFSPRAPAIMRVRGELKMNRRMAFPQFLGMFLVSFLLLSDSLSSFPLLFLIILPFFRPVTSLQAGPDELSSTLTPSSLGEQVVALVWLVSVAFQPDSSYLLMARASVSCWQSMALKFMSQAMTIWARGRKGGTSGSGQVSEGPFGSIFRSVIICNTKAGRVIIDVMAMSRAQDLLLQIPTSPARSKTHPNIEESAQKKCYARFDHPATCKCPSTSGGQNQNSLNLPAFLN